MANQGHLDILKKGVEEWNQWRLQHPEIKPDLNHANLRYKYLPSINFSNTILDKADLESAVLYRANLRKADLHDAHLYRTDFCNADLTCAVIRGADLVRARLINAILCNTDLRWVKLSEANLRGADLTGSAVYGISAWDVNLDDTIQLNLSITRDGSHSITVDRLEIAQLVHMLQDYKKLRDVLHTVMERGVLLLGRFRDGGLELLHALAAQLRDRKYLPMIFDFEKLEEADYTETVLTLAGLSKFAIADLSGGSVAKELYAIVPNFDIPFVPILDSRYYAHATVTDFIKFPWFLLPVIFSSQDELLKKLDSDIISPALARLEKMQTDFKETEEKWRKAFQVLQALPRSPQEENSVEITEDTINTLSLKFFRESVLQARPLTDEDYAQKNGIIQTLGGPVPFQPGDYLAQAAGKGEWPIAQQDFNKIYLQVPKLEPDIKGFAAYRKKEIYQACRMSEPFIIKHSNGYDMKGNSGDYVVRSGDKIWVDTGDDFERTYERTVEEKNKIERCTSEET